MDRGAGARGEVDTQGGRSGTAGSPRAGPVAHPRRRRRRRGLRRTVRRPGAHGAGTACRVIRDKAQAEEVTQDVMVEVWRTADRFRPARGAARNWVLTLAHRRAVDRVRSVAAGRARELRAAVREQERSFDTVAEEVETREEQRVVFRRLAHLTRELRLPLVLAYYEGLTYAEVAEALSMPAGTVKSRMRQGLRRLHDCMEAGCEPHRRPPPRCRRVRAARAAGRGGSRLRGAPGRLRALPCGGRSAVRGSRRDGGGRDERALGGPAPPGARPDRGRTSGRPGSAEARRRPQRGLQLALAASVAAAAALGGVAWWQSSEADNAREQSRRGARRVPAARRCPDRPRRHDPPPRSSRTAGRRAWSPPGRRTGPRCSRRGCRRSPTTGSTSSGTPDRGSSGRPDCCPQRTEVMRMSWTGALGGATAVCLTVEPAGGSRQPTTRPVGVISVPA
ncbi:hypothetical protein SPURM210S_00428 [Streptomyces purpurascens]